MTNEERIKRMTTEELAEWLFECVDCLGCPVMNQCKATSNEECRERFRAWLKEKKVKEKK